MRCKAHTSVGAPSAFEQSALSSRAWLVWFVLGVAPGCGSALKEPEALPSAGPPLSEYQTVPYPPPAAFVELVPPPPRRDAVWVDGHWTYRPTGYVWERGGWVIPPANGYYERWQLEYQRDGTILFAPAGWYDANGQRLDDPEVLLPAGTPPHEVTPEELQSGQ
jgi:hypothetical protein